MDAFGIDRYLGRLLVYAVSAVGGSMIGSTFTWKSSWVDADPLSMGPSTALFVLGPAVGVAAIAPLPHRVVAFVSLCFAAAMLAMWWLFVSSESSTASLVFLTGGWMVAVPISGALVLIASRHSPTRPVPTTPLTKRQSASHQ